jgi:hypothetical protein
MSTIGHNVDAAKKPTTNPMMREPTTYNEVVVVMRPV